MTDAYYAGRFNFARNLMWHVSRDDSYPAAHCSIAMKKNGRYHVSNLWKLLNKYYYFEVTDEDRTLCIIPTSVISIARCDDK